jgi:hypothetical protein
VSLDKTKIEIENGDDGCGACCFTVLLLVFTLGLFIHQGSQTVSTVNGTIASVSWERVIFIKNNTGEKDHRGRTIWESGERRETSGVDRNPVWPDSTIEEGQKVDSLQFETYSLYVRCDDGQVRTYTTRDVNVWLLYQIGDRVTVGTSHFGDVSSIASVVSENQ